MAFSNLLTLIDDIASTLDDVAVMTKLATKKTAGVLSDDLTVNAEQVSGVNPDREIPVIIAVAKGSALNKAILVPTCLAIAYFTPWLMHLLLVCGGAFLCFEGFEKVLEKFFKQIATPSAEGHPQAPAAVQSSAEMEAVKIKGAIKTDFILSAEIIVITMGTVAQETLSKQLAVLLAISVIMTFGVYGLVAAIIKLDDFGLLLIKRPQQWLKKFGTWIINMSPALMKLLGVAGTIAMFLVGGGIITHVLPWGHHWEVRFGGLIMTLINFVIGVALGGVIVLLHHLMQPYWTKLKGSKNS